MNKAKKDVPDERSMFRYEGKVLCKLWLVVGFSSNARKRSHVLSDSLGFPLAAFDFLARHESCEMVRS